MITFIARGRGGASGLRGPLVGGAALGCAADRTRPDRHAACSFRPRDLYGAVLRWCVESFHRTEPGARRGTGSGAAIAFPVYREPSSRRFTSVPRASVGRSLAD